MPGSNDVDRSEAMETFLAYAPLFEQLDEEGIDYCVVGGLGVMIQGLARNAAAYRMTYDIDLMVSRETDGQSVIDSYGSAFADTEESRKAFASIVLEEDYVRQLDAGFDEGENMTLSEFDSELDGFWGPQIDLCQTLNGYVLGDLERERLVIAGHEVTVATIPQLIAMKEDTIREFEVGNEPSSRVHDYVDLQRLHELEDGKGPAYDIPRSR